MVCVPPPEHINRRPGLRYTLSMTERIGIFGGTFDPPHLGHLILASESRSQLNLTRLLWVLTPQSPHKLDHPITSVVHRLEMVNLAIGDEPAFQLSTIEFERPIPQYTVDTINAIQGLHPQADLILLIGADSLGGLTSWRRPADLVAACHEIGVMRRPGESVHLSALESGLPGVKEKIHFVEAPLLQISSREIRRRVTEGLDYRYFLPPAVYQYIQAQNLYRI
jgi:nicotinate-nucleotide adenylyltransferase